LQTTRACKTPRQNRDREPLLIAAMLAPDLFAGFVFKAGSFADNLAISGLNIMSFANTITLIKQGQCGRFEEQIKIQNCMTNKNPTGR
jgi:hypothetical protein